VTNSDPVLLLRDLRWSYRLPARGPLQLLGLRPRPAVPVLDGLDLTVHAGEAVGLVGTNGAGKSTTLRLAAGILRPRHGEVLVRGRVRALLELGAGFDPSRSGWANACFLADVLDVDRTVLEAHRDEVEAMVGATLDRELRTYSQGMVLKLAFAVSTLDAPDLLLVDEAFLVGDAFFRGRALETVRRLRARGTAVIFAGHDLEVVRKLCDRAVWLEGGRCRADGSPEEVLADYLGGGATGVGEGPLRGLALESDGALRPGGRLRIHFELDASSAAAVCVGLRVFTADGSELAGLRGPTLLMPPGPSRRTLEIPALPLAPGAYRLEAGVVDQHGNVLARQPDAARLRVLGDGAGRGPVDLGARWARAGDGVVRVAA
jgi:lipopolysaccharide transport system ATP-binding protein